MRAAILTLVATALVLAGSPAGAELPGLTPVAESDVGRDLGRALEELRQELYGLGGRLRHHLGTLSIDPGPERPLISIMLRHREELGLTAEQVQRLEGLRRDFEREAIRRDADLRVAEMDLAALLEADAVDLGQVEGAVRQIERARADLRLARIRTIEQGKAVLGPEQRAKLRALLGRPPSSRSPGRSERQ